MGCVVFSGMVGADDPGGESNDSVERKGQYGNLQSNNISRMEQYGE
jgi:hypothetical protein